MFVQIIEQVEDEMEAEADGGDLPAPAAAAAPPLPDAPPDNRELLTAKKFFSTFNIKKGVDLMVECWRSINVATIQHGWKKALAEMNTAQEGAGSMNEERQTVAAAMTAVLNAAKAINLEGYNQVDASDMEELIKETIIEVNVEEVVEEEENEQQRDQQEPTNEPS